MSSLSKPPVDSMVADLERAVRNEELLTRIPKLPEILFRTGMTLEGIGRPDLAEQLYLQVIGLTSDWATVHLQLGDLFVNQGRLKEAEERFRLAASLDPNRAETFNKLGVVFWKTRQLQLAEATFRSVLALTPGVVEVMNNLGAVLLDLNRPREATVFLRRAVTMNPDYVAAVNNLGNALLDQNLTTEAMGCFRRALALNPNYGQAYNNLGNAFLSLDKQEEAIENFRRALILLPNNAEVGNNLGLALSNLGKFDEAAQSFERSIDLMPQKAEFHLNLSNCKRYKAGEPSLVAMQNLAQQLERLPQSEQIHLHFALGKAMEDIGDHEQAFHHFMAGNKIKRRQIVYDEAHILALYRRTESVFTRDLLESLKGKGAAGQLPVFVVGMPRSGTTLVEQILASHPQVFGAGELPDLAQMVDGLKSLLSKSGSSLLKKGEAIPGYPEAVRLLDAGQLESFGQSFLRRLESRIPAGPRPVRVIDKMPGNFRFAGLIPLVLPQARIISLRRDPIDTCLSCYSKLFKEGCLFSYELGELGRHYQAYGQLMGHWRNVLPPSLILEVSYEELVGDLRGQVTRILKHVGLKWNDACLKFHQKQRRVQTASAMQVRQPIYKTSINRWRPKEELLEPLLRGLGR